MITIETPPFLDGEDDAGQVLRAYLYRTVLSLEAQLQMMEERVENLEASE